MHASKFVNSMVTSVRLGTPKLRSKYSVYRCRNIVTPQYLRNRNTCLLMQRRRHPVVRWIKALRMNHFPCPKIRHSIKNCSVEFRESPSESCGVHGRRDSQDNSGESSGHLQDLLHVPALPLRLLFARVSSELR